MAKAYRVLWIVCALMAGVPSTLAAGQEVERKAVERVQFPPLGLPPVTVPADNPVTPGKVALGRKLFFDRRLSRNNTMSCGMCHIPEQGFTNNELKTPVGVNGRGVKRNAPTILNAAYQDHLFHDGRDTALETQVILPLLAENEMANPSIGYLVQRIGALPDYDGLFEAAFGGGPTIGRIGKAIASWERTMLAGASPFDQWYFGGRADAMTAEQVRGFDIFTGKGNCASCHLIGETAALFTDQGFHNTGIGYLADAAGSQPRGKTRVEIAPDVHVLVEPAVIESVGAPREPDSGRLEVTDRPEDLYRFKTPILRNVALTAPYMHDGSMPTLESVVEFYDRGGVPHDGLDPLIKPLGLTKAGKDALVAFLQALTSSNISALVDDARTGRAGN